MRVLVTWGSERGGTEGIGKVVADVLAQRGHDVTRVSARAAPSPDGFDAVIIGGALYANRWHRHARRYADRHARRLRRIPVWFFSSGPLDASADTNAIGPTAQVGALMARIGVREHVTFGGRLSRDARGFIAHAMARTHAGDWRNADRVRAWANEVADGLLSATPASPAEPPARSLARLLSYAFVGVAGATAAVLALMVALPVGVAAALAAPVAFAAVANRYFRPPGARQPLSTALLFAAATALPSTIVYGATGRATAFWLPMSLAFVATWAIGGIRSTLPWPKPATA
jgi:menaquinone-dependent protoporphyrinogen oxidase